MTTLSHNTQLLVFIVLTIKCDHLFFKFLIEKSWKQKALIWLLCLIQSTWSMQLKESSKHLVWGKKQYHMKVLLSSFDLKGLALNFIHKINSIWSCFKYIQGMSHKTHYLQYLPVKNTCSLLQNLQWTLISVLWETIKETSPKPGLQRLSHFREKIPQLNFFFFKIHNGFVVKVFTLQHSYNPLTIWPVWAGCIWKHCGGKNRFIGFTITTIMY